MRANRGEAEWKLVENRRRQKPGSGRNNQLPSILTVHSVSLF